MAKKPANRPNAGQFKKGQSGNPSGRPKYSKELQAKLRTAIGKAGPLAADALVDILRDLDPRATSARLQAAKYVLDRIIGPIPTELTGEDGSPITVDAVGVRLAGILAPVVDAARKKRADTD